MRKDFLRDVVAGSAGVLVVLAVIGLPQDPATTHFSVPAQWQGARLLPYYSSNLNNSPNPRLPIVAKRPAPPTPVPTP
jgi:hypothetical protein